MMNVELDRLEGGGEHNESAANGYGVELSRSTQQIFDLLTT